MALNFYSRNLCNPNISICREGRQLLGAGGSSMFRGDSQAPGALILNHERGREAHSCTADTSTRARSSFSLDTSERFSISLFKGLSNSFEQNSFFHMHCLAFILVAIEYIIKILVFKLFKFLHPCCFLKHSLKLQHHFWIFTWVSPHTWIPLEHWKNLKNRWENF